VIRGWNQDKGSNREVHWERKKQNSEKTHSYVSLARFSSYVCSSLTLKSPSIRSTLSFPPAPWKGCVDYKSPLEMFIYHSVGDKLPLHAYAHEHGTKNTETIGKKSTEDGKNVGNEQKKFIVKLAKGNKRMFCFLLGHQYRWL
jgi:hypothetical protein